MTTLAETAVEAPIRFEAQDDVDQLTVSACKDGRLIGVAVAVLDRRARSAHAVSLVVGEHVRRRGIGRSLLAELERSAAERGAAVIHTTTRSHQANLEVVTRILQRQGWCEPLPGMVLAESTAARLRSAPVLRAATPDGVTIEPLSRLSEKDRADLVAREAVGGHPAALGPFPSSPLEPLTSVCARRNGRVIGWMCNTQPDAHTVLYARLFVEPGPDRRGVAVSLISEAIKRQLDTDIPTGRLAIRMGNRAMLLLLGTQFGPYLAGRSTIRRFEKSLPI